MTIRVLHGDCRDVLPTLAANSVHCVVTSPPYYGLRDYGTARWDGGDAGCDHRHHIPQGIASSSTLRPEGKPHHHLANGEVNGLPFRDICGKCGARRIDRQLGLEATPDEYIQTMVAVFREVRRVLRDDGTCWVNMGDSYNTYPGNRGASNSISANINDAIPSWPQGHGLTTATLANKQLLMMPARLALALQADGWWLRSDIIWAKPNPMPESVTDRPTSAHEHVFLLTKRSRYFYDSAAIAEPSVYPEDNRKARQSVDDYQTLAVANCIATINPLNPKTYPERNARNVWTIATHAFSYGRLLRGVGDDSGRIRSPDCPVHGDQDTPVSMDGCDEQPAASLSDRSPHNDHRALSPDDALAPIATRLDEDCAPDNSDLLGLVNAQTASDRSTQSRRTDLAPATSLHVIDGAQSPSRTGRTELACEPVATSGHALGNNTSADGAQDGSQPGPSARKAVSNRGKCSCQIIDHFATFPPELVERCIKAGCPRDGTVLDPFAGAGTTMLVADRLQRHAIGIELNEAYATMARNRITADAPLFAEVAD